MSLGQYITKTKKKLQSGPTKFRRRHAEELTETISEVLMTAEATVDSNILNTLLRLFDEQFSGILQTQMLDVVGQLTIFATLREK